MKLKLTTVVMGSGPSLTAADIECVRAWRHDDPIRREAVVVNSTFRAVPWADHCYACDYDWLDQHLPELRRRFFGRVCTPNVGAAAIWPDVIFVPSVADDVLPDDGRTICMGGTHGHSGYQALAFAAQRSDRVVLLGFDCQRAPDGRSHHHEDHQAPLQNTVNIERWPALYAALAAQLRERNITVLNASRRSAITCFPRETIEQCLAS